MVFPILKVIAWPIFSLFIKRIDGVENLPNKPFIMVANHGSYLDGVLLGLIVAWYKNKQICFFATKERFTGPFWDAMFKHFGAIRVNGSLEKGLTALRQGKSMGIFPEGQRTYTGQVQKVTHTGLGILALLSKAPIVPVGTNTYCFWSRYQKIPNFKRNLVVTIGKPMQFKGKATKPAARKVVSKVMKEVKRLARISHS